MLSRVFSKTRTRKQIHDMGLDYIDIIPTTEERLSPKEFLRRHQEDARTVRDATFVPPRLGDSHFGYFVIPNNNGISIHGEE